MSDEIWIFDYAGLNLSRPFEGDWGVDAEDWITDRHLAMHWQSGFSIQYNIERWMSLGDQLEPEDIAPKFYQTIPEGHHDFDDNDLNFLPVIELRGIPALRADMAAIFQRFDSGSGWLKPVTLYLHDRSTKIQQTYYVLSVSEKKRTVDLERTACARPIFPNNPVHGISIPRDSKATKEIFTFSHALEGADIWKDPNISGATFISGRLHKALGAEGFDKLLMPYQCTLV